MLDVAINIVLMLTILVSLVIVHELGHLVMARRAGITVHEFGIFFGPRLRTLFVLRGIPFTLNTIPLGGYVKLEQEDGPDSGVAGSFAAAPLRTRLAVLFAGVTVNLILGWLILTIIAFASDSSVAMRLGAFLDSPASPSPARLAGLHADPVNGDQILAVNGVSVSWFEDPATLLGSIRSNAGQTVVLRVRSADGAVRDVSVPLRTPELATSLGALGVTKLALSFDAPISHSPLEALAVGSRRTWTAATGILSALGDIFTKPTESGLSGPIGMVSVVGDVRSSSPPVFMLYLVAMLSINLAVLNVLPIPPLDGGKIAFALARRLAAKARRGISLRTEQRFAVAGFLLLVALMCYATVGDLGRLLHLG